MNKIKIAFALPIVFFTVNSFAMEIYKGKTVKQKEWATGGAKVTQVLTSKTIHSNNIGATGDNYVETKIRAADAKVGEPLILDNVNNIYFNNRTDRAQIYKYVSSVCSYVSKELVQCVHYERSIALQPGGYVIDDTRPVLEVTYSNPGVYGVFAVTQVYGNSPSDSGGVVRSIADVTVS